MKRNLLFTLAIVFFISTANINLVTHTAEVEPLSTEQESLAAFETMLKVLRSPRCMNCHPTDDVPRQGEDRHPHVFDVSRGMNNQGGPIQKCQTCHRNENNDYSRIPGAPHWGLAPKTMGWMGMSDAEIGKVLTDPEMNGGRSPEDLVEHMGQDALVLWAWQPGHGREPAPVPLEEFRAALDTWLENGAEIPTE